MSKKITEYKAVVFDLDGTLYYQMRLRIKMAWMLFSYYLCHFWRIKEIFIVKNFRKIREEWDTLPVSYAEGSGSLEDDQYSYLAGKMNISSSAVKNTIETWMYEKPLKAVYETRDKDLLGLIDNMKAGGQKIFIFSDYPIEEKLKAIGLSADGMYAATDERINELKPSPKGLRLIMEDNDLQPFEILMVGDRMSRDGIAAENAGCDYIILPGSKAGRRKIYDEFS